MQTALTTGRDSCCHGGEILQVGGIGAVGLTLPALLQAEELEQTTTSSSTPPKSCIFIHQFGGLSQLDSWDMKPDAPQEIRGPYVPIQTATPGIQICELMPQLAKMSEHTAVIRSMTHHMAEHRQANSMYLAGRANPVRGRSVVRRNRDQTAAFQSDSAWSCVAAEVRRRRRSPRSHVSDRGTSRHGLCTDVDRRTA